MTPANEICITKNGSVFADGVEIPSVSSIRACIVSDMLVEVLVGTYNWSCVIEQHCGAETLWHKNRYAEKTSPEARILPDGISLGGVKLPGGYYFKPSGKQGELLIFFSAFKLSIDSLTPPYSGKYPVWSFPCFPEPEKRSRFMGGWLLPIFAAAAAAIAVRLLLGW
jgi:hypothetical protein|nr:MAG TPA: hypothetical protein [Caudoviricetes sp.]